MRNFNIHYFLIFFIFIWYLLQTWEKIKIIFISTNYFEHKILVEKRIKFNKQVSSKIVNKLINNNIINNKRFL